MPNWRVGGTLWGESSGKEPARRAAALGRRGGGSDAWPTRADGSPGRLAMRFGCGGGARPGVTAGMAGRVGSERRSRTLGSLGAALGIAGTVGPPGKKGPGAAAGMRALELGLSSGSGSLTGLATGMRWLDGRGGVFGIMRLGF